jgi:hypothetical protein
MLPYQFVNGARGFFFFYVLQKIVPYELGNTNRAIQPRRCIADHARKHRGKDGVDHQLGACVGEKKRAGLHAVQEEGGEDDGGRGAARSGAQGDQYGRQFVQIQSQQASAD